VIHRRRFLQGLGLAGGAALGRELLVPDARAWAATPARALAVALGELGATLGVRLTRFEDGRAVAVRAAPLAGAAGNARLLLDGVTVACRARATAAADRADATDLSFRFRVVHGRLANASLAVTLAVGRWSRDTYLLIPGAVYAANRFASRHMPYPPWLGEPSDMGPHVPPIVSDVPRLNIHGGESRIALLAGDTASPTLAVRVPVADVRGGRGGIGLILLAAPTTPFGQTGLEVEENDDRSAATLAISAPGVRPGVRYALCNGRVPSTDRGMDLSPGTTVTLEVRCLIFPCPDVQTLFDRGFEARRDRVGPARLRHELPLSAGRRLVETAALREQWTDVPGTFVTRTATAPVDPPRANDEPGRADRESIFQTGADGALALVLPLLATGGGDGRARAAKVLDLQLRGQAPSGFFHAFSDGTAWWDEGGAPLRGRRWTHVGRNAEALHLALRQVALLSRIDPAFVCPEAWRAGLARCADAFVRLWTRNGQHGQYMNVDTADICVGGSAAGALAPAALALAARLFDTEAYLRTAVAAAETLYLRFARAGLTLGDAPAALQCPDSRSAAALLESFVTLGEATREPVWFDRAAEIAHQLATWTVAWDAAFPETSTLGRLGARSTGAVLVSAQDKWGLPGFAGLSGDALFRLYRATGQVAYLELLRETVHNGSQYIATEDRLHGDAKPGWVSGVIPIGDALGAPGEVPPHTGSGTAEAACLLAAAEIPSLYVQPDTGFVFVFDHVEATIKKTGENKPGTPLGLIIKNPTRFEAELRIFSELDRERDKPLPPFPLWGARALVIGPGASAEIEFARPLT
jgi:hypothetical protein